MGNLAFYDILHIGVSWLLVVGKTPVHHIFMKYSNLWKYFCVQYFAFIFRALDLSKSGLDLFLCHDFKWTKVK